MITDPPPPSERLLKAAQAIGNPAFLIDAESMERNCQILRKVADDAGCRVVLAQKAFAQPQLYPLIGKHLNGACASGVWEAQLARDYFPASAEVITCAPAYDLADIHSLLPITSHLDFNSLTQWRKFREECLAYKQENSTQSLHFGLRINPEHSTGTNPLYDPCAPGSRLGASRDQLTDDDLRGLSGLHFHTLCEQGLEDLVATVVSVEKAFGDILCRPEITYLNLGGGHWITKEGYDRAGLVDLIVRLQRQYQLTVYLEPGEAVAIHSGILIAKVLDLHDSGEVTNAILNVSATAHMPDVLEMPYRPDVYRLSDGSRAGEKGQYGYRLAGNTCLAGDQIGDYTFTSPLSVGELLCFNDMAHYTMVKTTFFNGVEHPALYLLPSDGKEPLLLREFHYSDYLRLKA